MASGTLKLTTSDSRLEGRIVWSSKANNATNSSTVTAEVQARRTDSYTTTGTWIGGASVIYKGSTENSVTKEIKKYQGLSSTYVTFASFSFTVNHAANGTAAIAFSVNFHAPSGTSLAGNNLSYYFNWVDPDFISLDTIPRQATITAAPNFNDEGNPAITYSNPAGNAVTSLQACIADSQGKTIYVPYRDISKTGTSYTFNLTAAERTTLRNACNTANSMTVKFYIKTIMNGGTYYSNVAKTLTIVNAMPTLNPTVADINSVSLYVSGDANKVITGVSELQYTDGAAALKGATIKSRKIVCGSQTLTTASGSFKEATSNIIDFSVTDSRGNTTTTRITKTLVNYTPVSCHLDATPPSTSGDTMLTISGSFIAANFGKYTNYLTLYYRFSENDEDYDLWNSVDIDPTYPNAYSYEVQVPVHNLNYQSTYTFEARASDILGNANSAEKRVKAVPLFDWSEEDFTTRVPLRVDNGVLLNAAPHDLIAGTRGEDYQNVLGYEDNGKGTTNGLHVGPPEASTSTDSKYQMFLNGSNLFLNSDHVWGPSGMVSYSGLLKAMTNVYNLDTTAVAGTNYTVNEASASLVGNNLRIHINATRKSAVSGNVTNETVATLRIATGGKIEGALNVSFCSGATGPVSTFYTTSEVSASGQTLSVGINLAATGDNYTGATAYFVLPVSINTTAFDE